MILLALLSLVAISNCDLPVHCEWPQIHGEWAFSITGEVYGKEAMATCNDATFKPTSTLRISLEAPNVVTDLDSGITGWFTLIYDQGVEVNLEGKKYFAFFYYTQDNKTVTSYCDRTFVGWYHDAVPDARHWGCYKGKKTSLNAENVPSTHHYPSSWLDKLSSSPLGHSRLQFRTDYLRKFHTEFSEKYPNVPDSASIASLPSSFDWRNVNGTNYVNPVRDQAHCGSCYSFASTGMLSARTRIRTEMADTTVYAPQEVLDCSLYAQGCMGGFSYLIAGKYAEDFGLVSESCYPYEGHDDKCRPLCPQKQRTFAGYYGYVGGYYGGVTAEGMMLEIYHNGPVAVAFEVQDSLRPYKHGVYKCDDDHLNDVNATPPPPHFVTTNHAVQVVGWGVEDGDEGKPYWIVKNSWAETWGDKGYFLMERGINSCAIETAAFHAIPLVF